MPSVTCSNEDCGLDFEIDLAPLDRESNGSSGSHTTSYTYTGNVTCPVCERETEVTFTTDELNDTGEIVSID